MTATTASAVAATAFRSEAASVETRCQTIEAPNDLAVSISKCSG